VLVVGESCRDVAEHLPYFDEIRTVDDRALFAGSAIEKLRAVRAILKVFRGKGRAGERVAVSEAIVLHRDWRYAVLAWLARIGTRRGFSSPLADRFLTHPYPPGAREHHESQYLGVAGPGGGRNVKMSVDLKLWGIESYEQLAARLQNDGCDVVWLGDAHDRSMLSRHAPGVRLAGELSVPESAAVVSACRLVVTNDTMLLHLARALDVPALGIFGPTDPAHTGPRGEGSAHLWLGPDLVPCSPCHQDGFYPVCTYDHRCMNELPVDVVARTASALLGAAATREAVASPAR
jgi:ADP-heptose:LPS heptosyltransferase